MKARWSAVASTSSKCTRSSIPVIAAKLRHDSGFVQDAYADWLRHEHELALRRRALEQLVSAARVRQRQALGHDWVDLATTKQLEQHARSPRGTNPGSGAPRPPRRAAVGRRRGTSGSGRRAPAGVATACPRAKRPRPPRTTRSPPASSCARARAWRSGRTRRAFRRAAARGRSEATAGHRGRRPRRRRRRAGQLAHPSQEVLVAVVDSHRAEPLDRGAVASRSRPEEREARPPLPARAPRCRPCRPRRAPAPSLRASPSRCGGAPGRRSYTGRGGSGPPPDRDPRGPRPRSPPGRRRGPRRRPTRSARRCGLPLPASSSPARVPRRRRRVRSRA